MTSLSFTPVGLFADSVNDAASTRNVYLLASGLAALGIVLIAITVWFWRNTKHDPELLGPLEMMGERKFRKLDGKARMQLLDSARPADAKPMRWGVAKGQDEPALEVVDLRSLHKSSVAAGYDDLRDDAGPVVAVAVPAAEAAVSTLSPDDASDVSDGEPVGSAPTVDAAPATEAEPGAGEESDDSPKTIAAAADVAPPADVAQPAEVAQPEQASAKVTTNDDSPADPTAETEVDEFAILDAILASTKITGETPATGKAAEPVPLLIVPVDHELDAAARSKVDASAPRGTPRPLQRDRPEPVDADVVVEPAKPSIDPLLRKFDRDDA